MLRSGLPTVDPRRALGEALDQATADASEHRRLAEIGRFTWHVGSFERPGREHARFLPQAVAAHPV